MRQAVSVLAFTMLHVEAGPWEAGKGWRGDEARDLPNRGPRALPGFSGQPQVSPVLWTPARGEISRHERRAVVDDDHRDG